MMGGGPQGSSGSGTGSTANVYTPTAQPQADAAYQQIINTLLPAAQGGLAGQGQFTGGVLPSEWNYSTADALVRQLMTNSPYQAGALTGAQNASRMGMEAAPLLQGAGQQIMQTGFDPQNRLYQQMQQQALDRAGVANAMAGLGGTPYGASGTANALNNFDLNWQNNLLNRQMSAGAAGGNLLQAAPQLEAASAALPYNTGAQIANTGISGINQLSNLGNQGYTFVNSLLNPLDAYMKLGQAASLDSGSLGQLGFNQTAQGIGGLLGGANALFGGGGGGLLGSLGGLGGGGSGLAFSSLAPATQAAILPATFDTAAATSAFDGPGIGLAAPALSA